MRVRPRSSLCLGFALLLLLLSPDAPADSSFRCGYSVITLGAPLSKLIDACGEPLRIVRLENEYGAAVGQRWEYRRERSYVLFTVSGGRVVAIRRLSF
jgi:hypothetical protein